MIKKLGSIAALTAGWLFSVKPAAAQLTTDISTLDSSLGTNDPVTVLTGIINIFLSVLALIAVILIIVGGFQWMTARGNEEKVASAKKTLMAAVIGLVIIIGSWALATWLIAQFANTTGTAVV